jgi:hypothetical protein
LGKKRGARLVTKRINPSHERSIIISRPEKRPYGAKLIFQVLEKGFLGNLEHVTIFLDDGTYVTLAPERQPSWVGGRRFSLTLEGFPTASQAEEHGRRLVQGLLWTSISLNFGVRLNYHTHEPTTVYDRLRSPGDSMFGEATTSFPPDWVIDRLQAAYMLFKPVDRTLLLSMEIFCASHLEASDRAIFLSTVSALEPLANVERLGPEVDAFIEECLAQLDKRDEIQPEHRQSVQGRLNELRKESIRQALERVIGAKLPDDASAQAVIDYAYNLRSQLIHRGIPDDLDIDFSVETRKVSSILRQLYAKELGFTINH